MLWRGAHRALIERRYNAGASFSSELAPTRAGYIIEEMKAHANSAFIAASGLRYPAEDMPGHVRIRGTKKWVQAMNIYRRIKGQSNWQLAAGNRTKFPFDDDAPLAQPGIPETREYSVIGMMANEEVGLRSDLAVVTYGG